MTANITNECAPNLSSWEAKKSQQSSSCPSADEFIEISG